MYIHVNICMYIYIYIHVCENSYMNIKQTSAYICCYDVNPTPRPAEPLPASLLIYVGEFVLIYPAQVWERENQQPFPDDSVDVTTCKWLGIQVNSMVESKNR